MSSKINSTPQRLANALLSHLVQVVGYSWHLFLQDSKLLRRNLMLSSTPTQDLIHDCSSSFDNTLPRMKKELKNTERKQTSRQTLLA